KNRASGLVNSFSPGHLFNKRLSQKELTCFPIQHIEESITICLHQEFSFAPLVNIINQNKRGSGIPVMDIMRRKLVMPFHVTIFAVQRDHRVRIKIITQSTTAIR